MWSNKNMEKHILRQLWHTAPQLNRKKAIRAGCGKYLEHMWTLLPVQLFSLLGSKLKFFFNHFTLSPIQNVTTKSVSCALPMCWPTYCRGVIACEPLGSFQTHEVISDENVKKKLHLITEDKTNIISSLFKLPLAVMMNGCCRKQQ